MENNIQNNGTKKTRFNMVDAIAVILVLVIALGVFFVLDPINLFSANGKETVTLLYVVEFKGVDNALKSKINSGDAVMLSNTDYALGTVNTVRTQEAQVWEAVDGEMVKKTLADKSDIYVTIEVKCTYAKGEGYVVGTQQIAVGTPLALRFNDFFGKGYCVSIEQVK